MNKIQEQPLHEILLNKLMYVFTFAYHNRRNAPTVVREQHITTSSTVIGRVSLLVTEYKADPGKLNIFQCICFKFGEVVVGFTLTVEDRTRQFRATYGTEPQDQLISEENWLKYAVIIDDLYSIFKGSSAMYLNQSKPETRMILPANYPVVDAIVIPADSSHLYKRFRRNIPFVLTTYQVHALNNMLTGKKVYLIPEDRKSISEVLNHIRRNQFDDI